MTMSAHPRQALADMLGRSLGNDKAAATVALAAQQLGLGMHLNRHEALNVLEHIAQQPGIVGIAARFAKSRVHLVWVAD
jgi:hypothetical protein